MKILREGDRGTALSSDGRGWVPVTYRYRTIRLDKTAVDVPNVLVGVDDESDQVLIVPSQSTPRIKAARELAKELVFQVKIPHELDDVLVVIADRFEAAPSKFIPALLRYYLNEAVGSRQLAGRLVRLSKTPLARGRTGSRVSFRSSGALKHRISLAAKSTPGANVSVLTRGAILAAKEDLLDGKNDSRREVLMAVAQAL